MRYLASATILIALIFLSSAFAKPQTPAVLTQIHGNVLVDTGQGFVPVSEDVGLKLGDRVMVAKGAEAVLSYGANCTLPLQSPSMTTVEAAACTTSTQGPPPANPGSVLPVTIFSVLSTAGASGISQLTNNEDNPMSP